MTPIDAITAEIADRWEEIWGAGVRGRASEEMLAEIIRKHLAGNRIADAPQAARWQKHHNEVMEVVEAKIEGVLVEVRRLRNG